LFKKLKNHTKMAKTKFLFISIFFLLQQFSDAQSSSNRDKFMRYTPPGTVKISNEMYADISEITNHGYREFMYWQIRIYGEDSEEVRERLPDTTVWQELPFENNYSVHYFKDMAHDDYPVVGISLSQAKKYAKWRSDRVAELFLVNNKNIKPIYEDCTLENHFTIQRYLEGDFEWIVKRVNYKFPIYKIPNEEEWNKLAAIDSEFEFGIKKKTRFNKKAYKKRKHYFNTKEYFFSKDNTNKLKSKELISLTTPHSWFSKKINGLFDVYGNVSEMIDKPFISKGGSWLNDLSEIKPDADFLFKKPNCFTGFRCVAYWK